MAGPPARSAVVSGLWYARGMPELDVYETYEATIQLRRGENYVVKPECEGLDGQRMQFRALWPIGDDECSGRYAGEWAMYAHPSSPDALPVTWLASGDLVDVRVVTEETGRQSAVCATLEA